MSQENCRACRQAARQLQDHHFDRKYVTAAEQNTRRWKKEMYGVICLLFGIALFVFMSLALSDTQRDWQAYTREGWTVIAVLSAAVLYTLWSFLTWQTRYQFGQGWLAITPDGELHAHQDPPILNSGQLGFKPHPQYFSAAIPFAIRMPRFGDGQPGILYRYDPEYQNWEAILNKDGHYPWHVNVISVHQIEFANEHETIVWTPGSPWPLTRLIEFVATWESTADYVTFVSVDETIDAPRGRAIELEAGLQLLEQEVKHAEPQPIHGRKLAEITRALLGPPRTKVRVSNPAQERRGVAMIEHLKSIIGDRGLGA